MVSRLAMMRSTAVLIAVALAAACGGKKQRKTTDEVHVEMTRLRDRMCACTTPECADEVIKALVALESSSDVAATAEETARLSAVSLATAACEARVRGTAR